MAGREASGEYDYLLGDDRWDEPGGPEDGLPVDEPDPPRPDGAFDAFDADTWYFEPAPSPWYRTTQAVTAMVAACAAAVALVVSVVLLMFRGGNSVEEITSVTETAPTTVASTALRSSAPPPPPPPPPSEISAAPEAPAPVQTNRPRAPRTTKEPEIGVTRTPVTRSPISVAPSRPRRP